MRRLAALITCTLVAAVAGYGVSHAQTTTTKYQLSVYLPTKTWTTLKVDDAPHVGESLVINRQLVYVRGVQWRTDADGVTRPAVLVTGY